MKLINSYTEYIPQLPGVIGMYKHIERAMRNCYRSEDKITEDSYNRMLELAKKNHHYSVLEHGTVYLKIPRFKSTALDERIKFYLNNHWSRVYIHYIEDTYYAYITTNFRVIVENEKYVDLNYICEPEQYHEKRYTFKVVCSEAIARELNRHRIFSIAQQSTRYCNYSKGKFGNELTFIVPQWLYELEPTYNVAMLKDLAAKDTRVRTYLEALASAEESYMQLTTGEPALKAQEARGVLPLDTATTVFYTAFKDDWYQVIDLRSSEYAHPDVRVIVNTIKETLDESID